VYGRAKAYIAAARCVGVFVIDSVVGNGVEGVIPSRNRDATGRAGNTYFKNLNVLVTQ
jgi:hypothetical protein